MTLTCDLSSWKWCTTYRPLVCCMYAIYEVVRSNKQETTDITKFKWLIWPWPLSYRAHMVKKLERPLTFDRENGARHLVTSCVFCMPHMKWFSQIRMESWGEHGKKSDWPSFQMTGVTLTFWPGNGTRHIVTIWTLFLPSKNRSVK